ncbi:LacI family DNA-binding transcriptional regulator [Microbacterium lacus]|uniref:LacI family DNA-binding transcriptional regulator n=1 Tax=Microbacterium lacus TaxID=415217 RepID=A0ABP4T436_9MICO
MRKQPTIRDVASAAGVSVAVVSRVINEGTGPVAAKTRDKVMETIEELGFRPRAAARSLVSGTTTIGLIVTDLENPFFARLADRVVWEARGAGLQVQLMTTQEDAQLEREILDRLQDRSVAGIIATPTGANVDKWHRLLDLGVPITFVDRAIRDLPIDVVRIENVTSSQEATDHLLDLGHERIALISGPSTTTTGAERVDGYRRALEARAIAYRSELVHSVRFRGDAGADAVGSLLDLREPPTALIVANTAQVRNALRRLAQTRIAIPEDLSVVVFDDNPWTELVSPPLSVVRPPTSMLAVHALELVSARLRGRVTDEPRTISVPAEFVARSSTVTITPNPWRAPHS